MWTDDAKNHFGFPARGAQANMARAAGVTIQSVVQWGAIVPYLSALAIHTATKREVPLMRHHYDRRGRITTEATAQQPPL